MNPKGAKPTMQSCTSIASRNRCVESPKNTPNSFKMGVFQTNGLQYEPEGAKPTMQSCTSMVSRNRRFETQKNTPNSFKTGVSRPTGFNMNPKGQNRLWRIAQTLFHEYRYSGSQGNLPQTSKTSKMGVSKFSHELSAMNPTGAYTEILRLSHELSRNQKIGPVWMIEIRNHPQPLQNGRFQDQSAFQYEPVRVKTDCGLLAT